MRIFVLLALFLSCGRKTSYSNMPINGNETTLGEGFQQPMHWGDKKEWDSILKRAIHKYGNDLLASNPRDIRSYSRRYPRMTREEKVNFWAHLISLMAKKESNFDPSEQYPETFYDDDGNLVISRGLLQISYKSSTYYNCAAKNGSDLHNIKINLECGVKILNKWIRIDRLISNHKKEWRGAARYWGVFRQKRKRDYIKSNSIALF